MDITAALIVVAVIALVLASRFAGRPLRVRQLVVVPLILILWGGVELGQLMSGASAVQHPVLDGAVLGLGATVAVLGGVLRGMTVKVYVRDGHLWYRYRPLTAAVWVALIALRLGQVLAGQALGADQTVMNVGLLLILGLSLLGEAAVVGRKGIATGAPFAAAVSGR